MATSEALVKYYDCLRDSFNKIQEKDNKTALVNAALRPKICEEFEKSEQVLDSYLNYLQVFLLIYSEKFTNISTSVICPLFKEHAPKKFAPTKEQSDEPVEDDHIADKVQKTMQEIFRSKPELADEYSLCLVKFFPIVQQDDSRYFLTYLGNCLESCAYLKSESLVNIVTKILDRVNPPIEPDDEEKMTVIQKTVDDSFEFIYSRLDTLHDQVQLENFASAILTAFTREFLATNYQDQLNYLLLYICFLDIKLTDQFINLLWAAFTSPDRRPEERQASICLASSFMSRASYVDIDQVFNYLETASAWCMEFLDKADAKSDQQTLDCNETIESFHALVQSMFYLITQRYREMYEEESIKRLRQMNLDSILNSRFRPFENCNPEVEQRFREIVALYQITNLQIVDRRTPAKKRRKSDNDYKNRSLWKAPYPEFCDKLPDRIKPLYRAYYDHRNFTVYRD